ncbi:MAG: PilZ domain-containing protein [Rhodospirillaceae bacterium]|nr:PilZ domain-containing protein [Rhodospirillaceae bacterium]
MTDEHDQSPENRRGHVRRLVIMGATILYNDRKITIPCRVRDISETGARLEFDTQQLLPHRFELKIRDLPILQCELRWAKGTRAGVHFVEEDSEG